MKAVIIIPARYESSRFPGKPLCKILGKSMIRHVWERCAQALPADNVYIATDDNRIKNHCVSQNMQVLMTGSECLTGTDRVYESSLQIESDIYINVQGDEPRIKPSDILAVFEEAKKKPGKIINAMCPITNEVDFRNVNVPKVVASPDGNLLYMSRAPIPTDKSLGFKIAKRQVCIYAFHGDALKALASYKEKTPLEKIEDIEILRFLELGYSVQMVEVSGSSIAVDVPEDVMKVEAVLNARN